MEHTKKRAYSDILETYEKTKDIANLKLVMVKGIKSSIIKRSGFFNKNNIFFSLDCPADQNGVCVLKMKNIYHEETDYVTEENCKIFPEDGERIIEELREHINNSFNKDEPIYMPSINGKIKSFNSDSETQIIFELK